MVIQRGRVVSDNHSAVRHCRISHFDVSYAGLLFLAGKRCGPESFELLARNLFGGGNPNFNDVFGHYFIYLVDRNSGKQYAFCDNSGMFRAYRCGDLLATSFLELVQHLRLGVDQLNGSGSTEFLHFGHTLFHNTLVKAIRRIDPNELFVFENGEMHVREKGVTQIIEPPRLTMEGFFANLTHALDGKRISLDLTGGFDSRLVLSFFLQNRASFELAISGLRGNSDIAIAESISKILGVPFFPTFHSVGKASDEDLTETFGRSDSQIDVLTYHRNNQLNLDRLSRGVDVQISGVGGELYKDYWWLQDFPFYNKKKTDIHTLYSSRIESTIFPHSLLGDIQPVSLALRDNIIARLQPLVLDRNTRSYDNIYFNFKMRAMASAYLTTANNYFAAYAPLLEPEMVRIGFHLGRAQRFFNRYHRRVIFRNCKEIAGVRTTEGMTASPSFATLLSDIVLYAGNKAKRLLKHTLRKIVNKTFLTETPTDSRIYAIWRESAPFAYHVARLREAGILDRKVSPEILPDHLVGRILAIGMLLDRLKLG